LVSDTRKTKSELINELNALRKQDAELKAIYDSIGDGVMVLDLEAGTILRTNPALVSMLGYSEEELVGMPITKVHPPEELQRVGREMEKGRKGLNRVHDLVCLRKDGSTFPVDMTGMTINYQGRPGGVAIFRDITKRKKAEEALKASEQTLHSIFDSIPGLLFFKNKDNVIVRANKMLADSMGMKAEEIEGRPLSEIFPDYSEEYWKDDLEVIESGKPKLGIEEPMDTPEGTTWLRTDKVPYRDADGEIIGVIGFSVDITERKRVEEELAKQHERLQRINAELEGFSYTVSHDLRGPLSVIEIANKTLQKLLKSQRSDETQADIQEVLEVITNSVEKSGTLIQDLLTLAKAGQAPTELSVIDVGKVIEQILEEGTGIINEKGIIVDVAGDLSEITASPTHAYQLFSNLIGNAIRHNDSKSPRIEVSRIGDDKRGRHRYLVKDNGSGIPPDDLDRVFIPFFRGKTGGTGIGLSTVEKIVKLYGGSIKAYNDNGACFEVSIGNLGDE